MCCYPESVRYALIRDKIGGLDIYRFHGALDQLHISVLDLVPACIGAARDDLERTRPMPRLFREINGIEGDLFVRCIVPVHEEPELQTVDSRPIDPDCCITPVSKRPFPKIFFTDIVSPDKS